MSSRFLTTALVAVALALPAAAVQTPLEQATENFRAGKYAAVVELSTSLTEEAADWPRLQYLVGEARLVLGEPEPAAEAFRNVLAQRPNAVPAQVGLGRALTHLGQLEKADQVLRVALKAEPDDVGARTALGELLLRGGKLEPAVKELAAASKLAPTNPFTARTYTEALLASGQPAEAAGVAEAFARARPEHPMGPFLLAWSMERDGADEEAVAQYQKALELDANFLDAHKNLAILCHTLSNTYQDKVRTRMAFEHYARYFELGGKDESLRQTYDNLLQFKEQILGS